MDDPTVLITGFEPFGGERTNPSWDAVRELAERDPSLIAVELPCAFDASARALREAVERHRPDLVVCVGQAGGRSGVTPERVAINLADARIPDNDGEQPIDVPVVAGGPAAYFTGLPVKACVAALEEAGIPASVSHTAGTFVCNHVFYALMHLVATDFPDLRGGFVHVPFAPEQVADREGVPSLEVSRTADALGLIVATCLSTTDDLAISTGTLS
ncbi:MULTISPECIES: pyroglutamyl-peptidase I [Actinosynnema]|uniref:pyroglutamyl-peptidase I n=1 Tax=Actinosynnema TaxID=40566 RepID=UPI0020A4E976|nr:pyroglutamyl-peptidase I [Actinosynnema pretiosum]MCP2096882.1 pyroglutamyl-peptidase [Actinosynnema pretiosum]